MKLYLEQWSSSMSSGEAETRISIVLPHLGGPSRKMLVGASRAARRATQLRTQLRAEPVKPQVEPERFSEVAVVPSEQVVHNARAATPPPSLASLGFEVGSC